MRLSAHDAVIPCSLTCTRKFPLYGSARLGIRNEGFHDVKMPHLHSFIHSFIQTFKRNKLFLRPPIPYPDIRYVRYCHNELTQTNTIKTTLNIPTKENNTSFVSNCQSIIRYAIGIEISPPVDQRCPKTASSRAWRRTASWRSVAETCKMYVSCDYYKLQSTVHAFLNACKNNNNKTETAINKIIQKKQT